MIITEFLDGISDDEHRQQLMQVLRWIGEQFPQLQLVVKWQQPMFITHQTFIIGFSVAKGYLSMTPEKAGVTAFARQIERIGYEHTEGIIRVPWDQSVNYELIRQLVAWQIETKRDTTTFWRN